MKKLIALLFVLAALAACAPPAPEVIEKEVIVEKEVPVTVEVEKEVVVEVEKVVEVTAVPVPSKLNEAPMLKGLVAAGQLPPLEERLPKDVQAIDVYDSIGEYGGTWHTVTWNASDPGNNLQFPSYCSLPDHDVKTQPQSLQCLLNGCRFMTGGYAGSYIGCQFFLPGPSPVSLQVLP